MQAPWRMARVKAVSSGTRGDLAPDWQVTGKGPARSRQGACARHGERSRSAAHRTYSPLRQGGANLTLAENEADALQAAGGKRNSRGTQNEDHRCLPRPGGAWPALPAPRPRGKAAAEPMQASPALAACARRTTASAAISEHRLAGVRSVCSAGRRSKMSSAAAATGVDGQPRPPHMVCELSP